MKMRKNVASVLAAFMLTLGMICPLQAFNKTPQANVYKHEAGGIQFILPKGWKAEPDGDVLTVSSADDEMAVVFWVANESDFDAAVDAIVDELDNIIKNPKLAKDGVEGTHNGMKIFSVNGSGEYESASVLWDLTIVGAKKPVFVVSIANQKALQKHAAAYESLVKSVKRL